jgi:hypothetical protein
MPDDPPPESPSADPPRAAQVPQSPWAQPVPPAQPAQQSFPQPFQQPARQGDPFRSVWSMSPVADARAGGRAGRRRSDLRLGAGLVGGLVTFAPFALIATILWGWWAGEASWGSGGWVAVLIGAAAGFGIGGLVASQD